MQNLKVLVLDPNRNFRQAAAEYLRKRPEVLAVDTLAELSGFELKRRFANYHLIIIDHSLLRDDEIHHQLLVCKQSSPGTIMIGLTLYPQHGNYLPRWAGALIGKTIAKINFADEISVLLKIFSRELSGL